MDEFNQQIREDSTGVVEASANLRGQEITQKDRLEAKQEGERRIKEYSQRNAHLLSPIILLEYAKIGFTGHSGPRFIVVSGVVFHKITLYTDKGIFTISLKDQDWSY